MGNTKIAKSAGHLSLVRVVRGKRSYLIMAKDRFMKNQVNLKGNSIFKFGDTTWEQLQGTSIYGRTTSAHVRHSLFRNRRTGQLGSTNVSLSTDAILISASEPGSCPPTQPSNRIELNDDEWIAFQQSMSYGKLNCDLCTTVNFFDLNGLNFEQTHPYQDL